MAKLCGAAPAVAVAHGVYHARDAAHEKPEVLEVKIGPRRVPYWEAGASLGPYGRGYFPANAAAAGAEAGAAAATVASSSSSAGSCAGARSDASCSAREALT